MRLGFHYHIPALCREGRIYTPGYQARFLDSLAGQCEEVICFLHEPREDEMVQMDTGICCANVRLVSCGPHTRLPHRLLRGALHVESLHKEAGNVDIILLRGPSPLLPAFAQAAKGMPRALLLVGSYVESTASMGGPAWRQALIGALARHNQRWQDRIARECLVLVNSRKLYRYYEGRAGSLLEVRTTTLSEGDFAIREDTCVARPVRLLYSGRFDRAKGLADVIEALAILVRQGWDVVLDLVGWEDGKAHVWQEVSEKAALLCVRDRVFNHGRKAVGPELFAFYRRADIFVLASHAEGFPRALWEAMAHSLPIVATSVGSIPDLLMDGKEAILVQPKSPASLADGVRRLLEDEKLRRRVIHGGQIAARKVTLERGAIEIVRELQRWLTGEERGHAVSV